MHYNLGTLFIAEIVLENLEINQIGYGVLSMDQQLHRMQAALQFSQLKTELYERKLTWPHLFSSRSVAHKAAREKTTKQENVMMLCLYNIWILMKPPNLMK